MRITIILGPVGDNGFIFGINKTKKFFKLDPPKTFTENMFFDAECGQLSFFDNGNW